MVQLGDGDHSLSLKQPHIMTTYNTKRHKNNWECWPTKQSKHLDRSRKNYAWLMDVDRLNHLIFCRLIEVEYESSLSSLLCWYTSRYNAKFFRGNRSDSISQYLILSDFLKNQDVFASQINKEVMEMIIIYF